MDSAQPTADGTPSTPDQIPLQLARPFPTSYTIYVDGGWDSTDTDFYSAFQEQRDPINRRGSAGIAIVPTGTDWQQQGTIVITLNNGVHVGSQPAHMELAAIIVGLALRRWYLPPQQGDTIYSDCRSITDVINSATPQLSKFPAKLPFLQAILHHLQALKQQGVSLDWTKAHPEQRTTTDNYSHRDWGILLADCAASNHPFPDQIRIQQHLQISLPETLQVSMDPNTWYVSLPNGLPRISSPIILKRDTTTLTYLANKRSLQGLSLHMTRKIWKLHRLSFARRSTIIKLITGWNV